MSRSNPGQAAPCATLSLPPPAASSTQESTCTNQSFSEPSRNMKESSLVPSRVQIAFGTLLSSSCLCQCKCGRPCIAHVALLGVSRVVPARCPDGQPTPVSPAFPTRRSLDDCMRSRRTQRLRLERCERCPGRMIDTERKRPKVVAKPVVAAAAWLASTFLLRQRACQ